MIRTFRATYLARSLREKILIVCFALLLVGAWFSHFTDQMGAFWREARHTTSELTEQGMWLANRDTIEAAAQQAASKFDPSSTLSDIALTATATNLATDAGLSDIRADEEPDVSNGPFAVHTLHFEIPKADWQALQTFTLSIQKRHPYISIEQFQILGDKVSRTMTANMVLSSVEIARDNP
jgi:hypothetical protein